MILLESSTVVGVESGPPGVGSLRAVELGASIPNPTSSSARIEYRVPARGPVTLRLLDVSGREVRACWSTGEVAAGSHEAIWDGRDARGHTLPAGAYFYELTANGEMGSTRQIIRLK
jgi:flagellar hook assembly protein FlgD